MPAKLPKKSARCLSLVELFDPGESAAKTPPAEFRIFKRGVNSSVKGDFLFDDQAAEMVMASYRQRGIDVTIDYDHQTLATKAGVQAISAGWINLDVREGDLWATNVRWTDRAKAYLEAGEYRYFSPLFNSDEQTGRVEEILDVALTNTPALFDIEALVAASAHTNPNGGNEMDPKLQEALNRIAELERQTVAKDAQIRALEGHGATVALSAAVGLTASATADEVRSRVVALTAFHKDVLGLVGKDTDATALGALTAMKEKAEAEPGLREKLEKAEATALSASWGAHLDGLSTKGEDGKFLPPAKRKKAEEMALDLGGGKLTALGIEKAKGYAAEMLVMADGAGEGDKSRRTSVALSQQEIEIAQRSGSSIEGLTKYKEKKLAAGAGA
jgi:phage I-like protein